MTTNASDASGMEQPRQTGRDEPVRQRPNDERIRDLVNALGDPNHPLHSSAINELVVIGPPAVSALGAALNPNRPWLTSYRAAEALAQIGDGGASGALMGALRHPNSNVRWSAVRALAEVGDTRTLWALRRVAHDDRGKTSWGESVADTAQLALDRLQGRSALLRFTEPIKTAIALVAMLAALIFAGNRVQAVLAELRSDGEAVTVAQGPNPASTADSLVGASATAVLSTTATVGTTGTSAPASSATASTATPTRVPGNDIIGTVATSSVIRGGPGTNFAKIGGAYRGDELILIELSADGNWYRVRLGPKRGSGAVISGTGEGWINRQLVNTPPRPVPTARRQ